MCRRDSNWFGAGSASLGEEDSDSSIQSYENIYDVNWLRQGNKMIAPGIERVDTVKTDNGYEMKSIWCRSDLSDTSMLKLSTCLLYTSAMYAQFACDFLEEKAE